MQIKSRRKDFFKIGEKPIIIIDSKDLKKDAKEIAEKYLYNNVPPATKQKSTNGLKLSSETQILLLFHLNGDGQNKMKSHILLLKSMESYPIKIGKTIFWRRRILRIKASLQGIILILIILMVGSI